MRQLDYGTRWLERVLTLSPEAFFLLCDNRTMVLRGSSVDSPTPTRCSFAYAKTTLWHSKDRARSHPLPPRHSLAYTGNAPFLANIFLPSTDEASKTASEIPQENPQHTNSRETQTKF